MNEDDYENLLASLMGMLEVLYEAQIPPNDAFIERVRELCDEYGYEIPGGLG